MFRTKGEVKRLLVKNECEQISNQGKHEKWESPITGKRFSVPRNGVKTEKTWKSILEQAGIVEDKGKKSSNKPKK